MIYELLLIFISILFLALSWRSPKQGLFVLLACLPAYLLRFSVGPIPSTLLEVFVIILILIWLIQSKQKIFPPKNIMIAGGIILAAATIGIIVSSDKMAALGVWKAYFVESMLIGLIAYSILRTTKDKYAALVSLGVSSLLLSIFGIIQFFTRLGIPAPWDIERRITSVFDYPNALGLFIGPIIVVAIMVLLNRKVFQMQAIRIHTWFWTAVALFGTLAIIGSQTEAAWVAIPASLLAVSLLTKTRKWTIPIGIILLIAAFLITPIQEKLLLQDTSGQVRISQWTETIELIKDRPLFGSGLSGYPILFLDYHIADHVEIFQYPHNIILNIWTELGLLGLIGWLVLAYLILKQVLDDKKTGTLTPIQLIAFAVLIEMTIHGLVDVPYFKNDLAILTIMALVLSLPIILDSKKKK